MNSFLYILFKNFNACFCGSISKHGFVFSESITPLSIEPGSGGKPLIIQSAIL